MTAEVSGFFLPRHTFCALSNFCADQGLCATDLHKWGTAMLGSSDKGKYNDGPDSR